MSRGEDTTVDEDDDDKELDLETEKVITGYTQHVLHHSRKRLSTGNILRPIARTLARLGAHLGVKMSVLLREVAEAYESSPAVTPPAKEPPKRKPPKRARRKKTEPVVLVGPYYEMGVTADVADKLVVAKLVARCDDGHFHVNVPGDAHPQEHERMRARIDHFIEGLRN